MIKLKGHMNVFTDAAERASVEDLGWLRPQRAIDVNDNDNSHSNERKEHSNWEKTSSNDNLDNPLQGKALCCSKDTGLCLPTLPTPLRQLYLVSSTLHYRWRN